MDNPTIRKAKLTDAPQIAGLSGELNYPVEAGEMESRLERLLARADHVVFIAETRPNLVAGWIHGAEEEILEVGRVCEIWGLVVAESKRGLGVGRHLVKEVERWAVGRGLDQVSVRSNIVRPESHAFYQKIGYANFKTQHAYRKRIGPHRQS